MFKLNGIYRTQRKMEDINLKHLFLHSYKEYVSTGGETCPAVIFDEYGYSQDLKDSGYYKIVEILSEDECRHACQFVELRKMGMDPTLVLEWEFREFEYGEGPLETDAFLYQFHETGQSVDEICREIISKASI